MPADIQELNISAENLVSALLALPPEAGLCLLDSAGATHGNSHRLIAGLYPVEVCLIPAGDPDKTLLRVDKKLAAHPDSAAIFTIAYDFGLKLENILSRHGELEEFPEPDIFIAFFENLAIHDYSSGKTFIEGKNPGRLKDVISAGSAKSPPFISGEHSRVISNFSRAEYVAAVARAQQFIHRGDTYQINLTQQLKADLPAGLSAGQIFQNLRANNPVPFGALINRGEDTVVSASPERFLRVENSGDISGKRIVTAAPIKGTRPRGKTAAEDERLKNDLLASEKDRAENVMIVDLLRNDIGRVCKFGTVRVDELCALETHPTVFHLVSTIEGELAENVTFTDLLKATFPCGSITGAPKIRTMQLIDELETARRGLSMGAIGYIGFDGRIDMNVAIRTMVVRNSRAIFNVGGGIVADSVPEAEYEETLVKARALLSAINGNLSE